MSGGCSRGGGAETQRYARSQSTSLGGAEQLLAASVYLVLRYLQGGTELSGPIGTAAALHGGKEKSFSCGRAAAAKNPSFPRLGPLPSDLSCRVVPSLSSPEAMMKDWWGVHFYLPTDLSCSSSSSSLDLKSKRGVE